MTIQASGQIAISDLQAEFGGSGQLALSDYYRGGGLVPDIPVNVGIPTSGQIKLSDFYGASALPDIILNNSFSTAAVIEFVLSTATVAMRFNSDGSVTYPIPGTIVTGTSFTQWIDTVAAGNGDDYEMKWVKVSGSSFLTPGGTASDAWFDMNLDRQFSLLVSSGQNVGTYLISVRPKDLSAPTETLTLTLDVEATGSGGIVI